MAIKVNGVTVIDDNRNIISLGGISTVDGKVGIGTATPLGDLHVVGVSTFTSSVGDAITLRPNEGSGHVIRYGGNATDANVLKFLGVGDAEKMRITSGGNLGIGTTAPQTKLHLTDAVFSQYRNPSQGFVNQNTQKANFYSEYQQTASEYQALVKGNVDHGTSRINSILSLGTLNNTGNTSTSLGVHYIDENGNGSKYNQLIDAGGNANFLGTLTVGSRLSVGSTVTIPDRIEHAGDTDTYIQFHTTDQFRVVTAGVERFEVNNSSCIMAGDLTVNGGDIVLGGTGRIQGVDTVSASTDAANKAYVDSRISTTNGTLVTGTNGYQKFPNGFGFVWGAFSSNTDDRQTVTFHRAFNSVFGIQVGIAGNFTIGLNNTSFSFDRSNSVDGTQTVYYIAYGIVS